MKSVSIKQSDIKKQWVVIDATGQTLGRLATEIARVLRGKHKANYTPHLDSGDFVIVTNAEKVKLTGNKMNDKYYYHHTGYVGGIKAISAKDMLVTNPAKLVMLTVKGMLPKNKLTYKQMTYLKVYRGSDHPHAAQKPVAFPPRLAGGKK